MGSNPVTVTYRLLILSLSAMFSCCRTDRIDIDENKFCLSIDILSPKKYHTLNFPLKPYLLIYYILPIYYMLPFQTLTSTAKGSVVTMQR